MPTYDYRCTTCGHRFEYFQSITSDALAHCPKDLCIQEEGEKKGTGVVVRLVSGGAGLVFKGEGFYLTDYVRKGGSSTEGGASPSHSVSSKPDSASGGSASGGGVAASGGASSGGGSSSGGASSGGPASS